MKVLYDKKGNSLTIWFDDPKKEIIDEEIGEDMVVMKDKQGHIIGIEKLNYNIPYSTNLPIEILSA